MKAYARLISGCLAALALFPSSGIQAFQISANSGEPLSARSKVSQRHQWVQCRLAAALRALETAPNPPTCTPGENGSLFPPPTPNSPPNEFLTFYDTSVELMVRTAIGSRLTVTASAVAVGWVLAQPSRVGTECDRDFACDDRPSAMNQAGRWSGLFVSIDDVQGRASRCE